MNSEGKIQQSCVMWLRNEYGRVDCNPKIIVFSVPNESKNMKEIMTKKQTGLLAGASDLVVVLPDIVLFLECKDSKGKQSDKQIKFEDDVLKLGHPYHVFRSLEEFQRIIFTYL